MFFLVVCENYCTFAIIALSQAKKIPVLFLRSNLIVLTGLLLNNTMQALFKAIASTPVRLQKRKNQPRAIKCRQKPYPLLMVPRHEACAMLY